jgi:hypothetical protein
MDEMVSLLDAKDGSIIRQLPNPMNYFFTQTKFVDDQLLIAAVRDTNGRMALITIDPNSGQTTPSSIYLSRIGISSCKIRYSLFSCMDGQSDKVFALSLKTRNICFDTEHKWCLPSGCK